MKKILCATTIIILSSCATKSPIVTSENIAQCKIVFSSEQVKEWNIHTRGQSISKSNSFLGIGRLSKPITAVPYNLPAGFNTISSCTVIHTKDESGLPYPLSVRCIQQGIECEALTK